MISGDDVCVFSPLVEVFVRNGFGLVRERVLYQDWPINLCSVTVFFCFLFFSKGGQRPVWSFLQVGSLIRYPFVDFVVYGVFGPLRFFLSLFFFIPWLSSPTPGGSYPGKWPQGWFLWPQFFPSIPRFHEAVFGFFGFTHETWFCSVMVFSNRLPGLFRAIDYTLKFLPVLFRSSPFVELTSFGCEIFICCHLDLFLIRISFFRGGSFIELFNLFS